MARIVNYRRLIAVDITYGVLVAVGLVALFVPGVLPYVYLGLAAPAAEIEDRGVRDAFVRSFRLVRGHFWLVLAVLGPIELVGGGLINLTIWLAHKLVGDSLVAKWLADTAANIAVTPVYAVAAVLLTLELIAHQDGEAPRLHSGPTPA